MKIIITVMKLFTGLLFIFSGVVKAIDPKGLAFKMQEFFEAWAGSGFLPKLMQLFNTQALTFSVIMITLEVVVGVALIVGWQKKFTLWILFLLILFFTFLTSYVLFSDKIRACGCFGDCIPLTPIQTFTKDIVLLVFAICLLVYSKYITPIAKPLINFLYVLFATIAVLGLQAYVLRNLPLIDCLPYKEGNNILELQKMPTNAIPDKYEYLFVYEKDGAKKEFAANATPDSPWVFVDRQQKLIQKGSNNVPVISDFSLTTEAGFDSTEAILNTKAEYYLLYIKDLDNYPTNWDGDKNFVLRALAKGKSVLIVTAQLAKVKAHFLATPAIANSANKLPFLSCDATIMKTVARVNPTLYLMNAGTVVKKWSWTDLDKLLQ